MDANIDRLVSDFENCSSPRDNFTVLRGIDDSFINLEVLIKENARKKSEMENIKEHILGKMYNPKPEGFFKQLFGRLFKKKSNHRGVLVTLNMYANNLATVMGHYQEIIMRSRTAYNALRDQFREAEGNRLKLKKEYTTLGAEERMLLAKIKRLRRSADESQGFDEEVGIRENVLRCEEQLESVLEDREKCALVGLYYEKRCSSLKKDVLSKWSKTLREGVKAYTAAKLSLEEINFAMSYMQSAVTTMDGRQQLEGFLLRARKEMGTINKQMGDIRMLFGNYDSSFLVNGSNGVKPETDNDRDMLFREAEKTWGMNPKSDNGHNPDLYNFVEH